MTIDPQEAKKSLDAIKQVQSVPVTSGSREIGWLLIIWGVVWLVGFLTTQWLENGWLPWIWLPLLAAGALGSTAVGIRMGRQVQYTESGPRLALFYPLYLCFCLLWLYLARPATWEEIAVIAVSFVGFAAVVSGIQVRARSLVAAGLAGTIVAVLVYLLLLPFFGLVVGLLGGGGMIVAGWRFSQGGRRG